MPTRLAVGLGPKRLPYAGFPVIRPLELGPPFPSTRTGFSRLQRERSSATAPSHHGEAYISLRKKRKPKSADTGGLIPGSAESSDAATVAVISSMWIVCVQCHTGQCLYESVGIRYRCEKAGRPSRPATRIYCSGLSSTRRLLALPSSVSLLSMGRPSP